MRLLIYGINYAPELTGVGKYTGEMAEALAAQGHEVCVVTAPPYYPAWQVGAGFCGRRYHEEFSRGVKVWRCPLWVPYQPSGLKRLLHLLSFAVSSLPIVLWQGLTWHPDVVFVVEPPFFCVAAALLTSRLSGAKTWLHIQDFEIDAGFELGLLPTSRFIRSLTMTLERWLMNRFDRISTLSDGMLKRLQRKRVDESKCIYFPNWVDTETIYPLQGSNPLRDELAIAPNTFVALYSGSMGEKQGLEVVIAAAKLLETYPKTIFVLCGQGSAKKQLLKLAQGMENVRFLDLQPVEKLNALLNLAYIHLLPQLSSAADLVMPSKLKGMYASGRPVIATAKPGTQVAQVVQSCGVVIPPEDASALASAITYLVDHPDKCSQLGEAAREFAVNNWCQETILGQFEQDLIRLCSSPKLDDGVESATPKRSLEVGIQENPLSIVQSKPIGSYLVEAGLVTKSQVDVALIEQQVTGIRLGEILVGHGWIEQQLVEELMSNVILPERSTLLDQRSQL